MRTALMIVLLGLAVQTHALLNVTSSNGWYATLQVRDTAHSFPLLLVIVRDNFTNTEFILENQKSFSIRLDYPDGEYGYYLYDSQKKNLLDKGQFVLNTPFTVSMAAIDTDHVTVQISARKPVQIEAGLFSNDVLVEKRTVQAGERTRFGITNLAQNREYRLSLTTANYRLDRSFTTKKRNLALFKPVHGTFTRFPESRFVDDSTPAITRINDGQISWYKGMAVSEEVTAREQIALVNLESAMRLGQIRVVWHGLYYPLNYDFIYSDDGKVWKTVERKKSGFKTGIAPDNSPIVTDDFPVNISAKYIGVKVRKGQAIQTREKLRNFVELMEIEAYE